MAGSGSVASAQSLIPASTQQTASEHSSEESPLIPSNEAALLAKQTAALRLITEQAKIRQQELHELQQTGPEFLQRLKDQLAATTPTMPLAPIPADWPLSKLETRLTAAEATLRVFQSEFDESENIITQRTARLQEIPPLLIEARKVADEIRIRIDALTKTGTPSDLDKARLEYMKARMEMLAQEAATLESELLTYQTRSEVPRTRRDLAARRLAYQQAWVNHLRESITVRQIATAETDVRRVEDQADNVPPLLKAQADINTELARQRTGDGGALALASQLARDKQALQSDLSAMKRDYRDMQSRIKSIGLTGAVGTLIFDELNNLPPVGRHLRRLKDYQNQQNKNLLLYLEYQKEHRELSDEMDAAVSSILAQIPGKLSPDQRLEYDRAIRAILLERLDILKNLILDHEKALSLLTDVEQGERDLIATTEEYSNYLRQSILWVRTTSPLWPSSLRNSWQGLRWFLSPLLWSELVACVSDDIMAEPIDWIAALIVILIILTIRPLLKNKLIQAAAKARELRAPSLSTPLSAFLSTVGLSLPLPVALLLMGHLLGHLRNETELSIALSRGLGSLAVVRIGLLEFLRQSARPQGLAEAHLRWPAPKMRILRFDLTWMLVLFILVSIVVRTLFGFQHFAWQNSLSALAMIALLIGTHIFLLRALRPQTGSLSGFQATTGLQTSVRWKQALRHLIINFPLALLFLIVIGYIPVAMYVTVSFYTSLLLILAIVWSARLVEIWLDQLRAHMVIESNRESMPAEAGVSLPLGKHTRTALDILIIKNQASRVIRGAAWLILLAGLWIVWKDVFASLGFIARFELWSETNQAAIQAAQAAGAKALDIESLRNVVTVGDVLLALAILVLTIGVGHNLPGFIEMVFLRRLPLDSGARFGITTITRYAIYIVGMIVAFQSINIGWSKLQWLVAAVSVGLGFGLQEIFANFVSGLIILSERPVRLGDIVTVGDVSGRVTQIKMRATVIMDWDRRELLVPNKEFVTSRLINWTLTDPINRMMITVGIAYGSDVARARAILLQMADSHPRILKDPPPSAVFAEFGNSTLNFRLYSYIPSREYYLEVLNDLNTAIDREFRAAGIEIAFPQQDIHIRSIAKDAAGALAPAEQAHQTPPSPRSS